MGLTRVKGSNADCKRLEDRALRPTTGDLSTRHHSTLSYWTQSNLMCAFEGLPEPRFVSPVRALLKRLVGPTVCCMSPLGV